jgi:ZIP family zinc transporter
VLPPGLRSTFRYVGTSVTPRYEPCKGLQSCRRVEGEALVWGIVAGSSLVLGGLIALFFEIPTRAIGLVMAFGAGVLISAVAYELVADAFETSGGGQDVAAGLGAGALAFYLGDAYIDSLGGDHRKRMSGQQSEGSGLALTLGIVLDGVPEAAVIGLSLVEGGVSAAMIVAVFLSNLPEAIAATTGLSAARWPRGRILGLWIAVMMVTGLASLAGYGLLSDGSPSAVAFVQSFAAGALLTMLADTMMPEAFERGGKLVGLFTTLGFAIAFAISSLE